MASVNTITYTASKSIDYVTYDAAREVTDLAITNSPVVNLIDLSWTHSSTPGTYEVWHFDGQVWTDSGLSTTSTSITVDLPSSAIVVQLRNNNQPSNDVVISYQQLAPVLNILATNRYDGVKISWTPFIDESVEIRRGSTIIYQGLAPSSAYFIDTDATTTAANYTATSYIGVKPTDFIESADSNTVSGNKLISTPVPEPNPIPADCFIGIRPGTGIIDTGTDELGNPVSVIPAEGRFIITKDAGLESDLIGTSSDLDDDTYFHSDNEYVFVDSVSEISTYSSSSTTRSFELSTADKAALDAGSVFMIRFTSGETHTYAAPIFKRTSESYPGIGISDIYTLDSWWFSGGAQPTGHYVTGNTHIVTNTTIDSITIYFLNLTVSGNDLVYEDRTKTNLEMTPQVGGPGEVYIDGTYFRVNGIDFGTLKFLCNLGKSTDGNFVSGLRNVYDDVIPLGIGASSDVALNHYGDGSCLQVLGSYPDAAGWYMDFENGMIWRESSGGDKIDWWNAAKGRTRLKYEGVSSDDGAGDKYETAANNIAIHTDNNVGPNDLITEREHFSQSGIIAAGIPDMLLDMPLVYPSSIFGVVVTPIGWEAQSDGHTDQVYITDRQSIIFSDFTPDDKVDPTDFVPIYKFFQKVQSVTKTHTSGDPYRDVDFEISGTVYLARMTDYSFRVFYSYSCNAWGGSVVLSGEPTIETISVRIPNFSYSFLQMR